MRRRGEKGRITESEIRDKLEEVKKKMEFILNCEENKE